MQVLNGPVSADDWARWEDRARRVRCFVFADHARWQLDAAFLPVLMDRARDLAHPLFPNLQAFAVRESLGYPPRRGLLRSLAHSSASLFAVAVATQIPLPFRGTLVGDLAVLQEGLAATGARLRYMNVYSHYQRIHVTLPFARFGDLQTIHTSPMTLAGYRYMLPHLGALEELEELIVAVDDDPMRAGDLAGKPLEGLGSSRKRSRITAASAHSASCRSMGHIQRSVSSPGRSGPPRLRTSRWSVPRTSPRTSRS